VHYACCACGGAAQCRNACRVGDADELEQCVFEAQLAAVAALDDVGRLARLAAAAQWQQQQQQQQQRGSRSANKETGKA
jgi:hypothetical protein